MYTTNLFDRLKLGESFSRLIPTTMIGESIVTKYNDILKSTKTPVSDFHNLMLESVNSGDKVLENWARTTSNYITENFGISWRFNLIHESLTQSGNVMNESIAAELKYLSYCGENSLTEAIANGALKNSLANLSLKKLHEDVTGVKTANRINESWIAYTPISFVEKKNGSLFFSLNGRIYEDAEEGIKESDAPSAEFAEVNSVVQEIPYNPANDEFSVNFFPAAVNVTSSGKIKRHDEILDIDTVHEIVKESIAKVDTQTKMEESMKFDRLKVLSESIDSMYKLDNVTTAHNTVSKTNVSLVEHVEGFYIITESGIYAKCSTLNEAVDKISRTFGANLSEELSSKLQQEAQDIKTINQSVEQQKLQIEQLKQSIEQCNQEQMFCDHGSEKWQEFENIKQDAQDAINAIEMSMPEL